MSVLGLTQTPNGAVYDSIDMALKHSRLWDRACGYLDKWTWGYQEQTPTAMKRFVKRLEARKPPPNNHPRVSFPVHRPRAEHMKTRRFVQR